MFVLLVKTFNAFVLIVIYTIRKNILALTYSLASRIEAYFHFSFFPHFRCLEYAFIVQS